MSDCSACCAAPRIPSSPLSLSPMIDPHLLNMLSVIRWPVVSFGASSCRQDGRVCRMLTLFSAHSGPCDNNCNPKLLNPAHTQHPHEISLAGQ